MPIETSSYMCEFSGSRKEKTDFYFFETEKVNKSSLEIWIIKNLDKDFKPKYKFCGSTSKSIFGRELIACGAGPEISNLTYFIDEVIKKPSQEEIIAIINIFKTGTSEEKLNKVLELAKKFNM